MNRQPISPEWQARYRAWLDGPPGFNRLYPGCALCTDPREAVLNGLSGTRYMVTNKVWAEAELPSESRTSDVCIECLEKRLGRCLTVEDFADVPMNRLLMFGYDMGVQDRSFRDE